VGVDGVAWTSFIKAANPGKLLETLRVACAESAEWVPVEPDPEFGRAFGEDYFTADYQGSGFVGRGLSVFVSAWKDEPGRVRLTMHAERWSDDRSLPGDAEYGRAEDLAAPLLHAAGKLLGKRLKLCRPPPDRVRPLRGILERAFCSVTVAYQHTSHPSLKPRSLHPNDQERYWRFIRIAHQHQSTLRPSDVAFHLTAAGFHPELVAELEGEYRIGRQVLAIHDEPWNLRRLREEERRRRRQEDSAEYERVYGKPLDRDAKADAQSSRE
jgi:hypothetical protein